MKTKYNPLYLFPVFLVSLSSPLPAEEITVPTTVSTSAETTPAKKPEDPVFSVLSDAEASSAEADVDSLFEGEGEVPEAASDDIYILEDFIVSVEQDRGYYSANSLAATRTNQLVKDTPMTISIVNEQLMEDLNLFEIDSIATVVPSVEAAGESFSNRLLRFRGLLTRFQLFEFIPRQISQNGYNVDRVEVVRGANSLIYGQAAPGGKANFLAKRAVFGNNKTSLGAQVGDKGLFRSNLDWNYEINDKLAVRLMGVHQEREFNQRFKEQEFQGGTLAATYMPGRRTRVNLHVEGVHEERNSPPAYYQDNTGQYGYTGMLRLMPATPDIVDLLDDKTINAIINYNDGFGLAPAIGNLANARVPDFFTSKQDIKDFFSKRIVIPNRADVDPNEPYVVRYEDPAHNGTSPRNGGAASLNTREVDGHFILADVTHSFSDSLQGKLAVSHEDSRTSVLNRGDPRNLYLNFGNFGGRNVQGADGTSRRAYADGLFSSPFWQRFENSDQTKAIRGTLSYDLELFGSNQQLLFGLDLDQRKSWQLAEDLLAVEPNPTNGSYSGNVRAEDFLQADQGIPNAGIAPNTTGESNVTGNILTDPNASRIGRTGIGWFNRDYRKSTVSTSGVWTAAQGKYMNGRLNTLIGVRYDYMSIDGKIQDFQAGNLEPKDIDVSFNEVSPTLGGLFWLTPQFGVFANYAESIESPTGWQLDPDGESVPAETGTGIEYGIKFDCLKGDLNGQLIAFHIEKENEARSNYSNPILEILYPYSEFPNLYPDATGPDDTGGIEPLGRNVAGTTVESQGIELDLYYNPSPSLSIFLGYAYVDATYKESAGGILDGLTLPGTAHHNANLTLRYTFRNGSFKGFYLGANQKYRSRSLLDTLYEDISAEARPGDLGDGREDVTGLAGSDGVFGTEDDSKPRTHEVWLDDQLETAVFAGWLGKLTQGRDAPVWNFQLTVDNLFDAVDLVSTGNARFTEGRTVNFRAGVKF